MSSNRMVATLFDNIAKNMIQYFEGWDTYIPHKGEKGGVRERRVRDFLNDYLPKKYGVGSGHIIDKKGNVSLQEDIVIYDKLNSPVLNVDSNYQVFPCETVYATVEIKSKLMQEEIEKCVKHASQLHKLDRADHRGDLGTIPSFIFAYDSYESGNKPPAVWARDKFRDAVLAGEAPMPLPSAVLCLSHSFVLRRDIDQIKYVTYAFETGALLHFFTTLLHRLSLVQTNTPLLFSHYGWMQGTMTEYDQDGNPIPVKGVAFIRVDTGKKST